MTIKKVIVLTKSRASSRGNTGRASIIWNDSA